LAFCAYGVCGGSSYAVAVSVAARCGVGDTDLRTLDSSTPRFASLSTGTLCCHTPKVGAVWINVFVRICAGAISDGRPYRDSFGGTIHLDVKSANHTCESTNHVIHQIPAISRLVLIFLRAERLTILSEADPVPPLFLAARRGCYPVELGNPPTAAQVFPLQR
jgi:hypothetical protein